MYQRRLSISLLLVCYLLFQGCTSGQTQAAIEPTVTPTSSITPSPLPTSTPTLTLTPSPTPIPGIGTEILVDGIGFKVQAAIVGAEPLANFRLRSGYDTTLHVQITFPYEEGMAYLTENFKKIAVVDKNGRESSLEAISDILSNTPWLLFEVAMDLDDFSLKFPDGQVVALMSILQINPISNVDGIVSLDGKPLANHKVDLTLDDEVLLTTQTDKNGYYLFADVAPNDYAIKIVLEGDTVNCEISSLVTGVMKGWQARHDFILENSVFTGGEFTILDGSLDLAICKPK